MKTMKWLLRREFWEHKGAMVWAPLVAAALIFAVMSSSLIYGLQKSSLRNEVTIRGDSVVQTYSGKEVTVSQIFDALPAEKKNLVAEGISNFYLAPALPLFMMMAIIIFFYCLSALNEERRDRSILFWKSLPVSDLETVSSKVVTAVLVIPVVTIGVALALSFLLLMVAGLIASFKGVNMFGAVLGNGDFYLMPLRLIALLPVYIIWALPTIGWLMLVSAWAKSKVFLWAVVAPLIAVVIVKWATMITGAGLDTDWVMRNMILRALVSVVPGIWLPFSGVEHQVDGNHAGESINQLMSASYMTLGTGHAIVGAIVGLAMIYGATRVRRWRDEG